MKIRAATLGDAAAIASIYAPYVMGSSVSFETVAPNEAEMRERMAAGGDLYPWFVVEDEQGAMLGYAYATRFRPRPAYHYTVETTIYLDPKAHGQGIGKLLYETLLRTLEKQRFVQAIAAITLPNDASVRLHEALGFKATGVYRQVGYKGSRWLDVGLWQRGLAPATNPPTEPVKLSEIEGLL